MGALLRAVPTRKSFPRGGVSRGHGAQHRRVDRNIRQAPLPTLRRISLSRFSFLLSLPSFSYSLFAFSFATPMRRWRSAGGAQVHARHPSRHAMTGMRAPVRRPAFPATGRSPLGAPPWRFSTRARARRCPAFPPGSCGDLVRRTGHRYPEERVSRAPHGAVANRLRGRHASLRLTGSPLEAPLMSEVDVITTSTSI
jgi:hypothetical protein